MNKKVVWLPYDFDTALGINNEGALVFSYNLEDIDHIEGGADVFNGQDSVVWNNVRDAFAKEIKQMYQELRSQGDLSYSKVEELFENHQDKWGEAIFNEDAYFKYLAPLVAPDAGKEPTGSYLSMLQGSKKEQRKWWLYNRFRYMDSKYNAGDALSDVVQLRGYAKADVSVTPYADVYASVKYGSYLVQARGQRNVSITLPCPLDNVNDTEIYIYSASQLAAIGDVSGLLVGFADFSMATKIQNLKIGDSSGSYSNSNLKELYLGANVLLKNLDVRNCPALGTGTQSTVDISGCSNIENVYFDGTSITGLTLPNGGVLKVLHLPSTITNLTIMNQIGITDLTIPSYANISTLRLENVPTVNSKAILNAIPVNTRVRLIGFSWEATNAAEIISILDRLDLMRGLDEHGNNMEKAQVSGTIHTGSLTGAEIASFNERYPYLKVTADHISCKVRYLNADGSLMYEETVIDGADATYNGTPSKPSTAQYTFTFAGWSKEDDNTVDADAKQHVTADRILYPCYTNNLRHYTATFVRAPEDGGGTLYTQSNIPYGTIPTYSGETPTTTRGDAQTFPFDGWTPALGPIVANTTYIAKFKDTNSPTRALILRRIVDAEHESVTSIGDYAFASCSSLTTISFPNVTSIGNSAFYRCSNLTTISFPNATSIGANAFQFCSSLTTISFPNATSIDANTFERCSNLTTASFPNVTSIGNYAFRSCYNLTTISFPNVTSIGGSAFYRCSNLTTASFPNVTSIGNYAFASCSSLTTISFPNATSIGNSAFQYCSNLTTASFPNVTSIGNYAFASCSNLTMAIFLASRVVSLINSNAFLGTSSTLSIYVPASLVGSYKTANNWSYYSSRITEYGGE